MVNDLKKDKNIQIIKMGYTIYNPINQRSILNEMFKRYYKIFSLIQEIDIFNETETCAPSRLEYECRQFIIFYQI